MEYIELNNGVKMPKAGFGVYQISKDECEECVLNAIKVGYRLIDIAQVILRWLIQRNVVALSKTTDIEKMKENINIFDFELSNEDMQEIAKLDTQTSSFFSHYNPNMVAWFDQIVVSRRTNHDHSKDKKNW